MIYIVERVFSAPYFWKVATFVVYVHLLFVWELNEIENVPNNFMITKTHTLSLPNTIIDNSKCMPCLCYPFTLHYNVMYWTNKPRLDVKRKWVMDVAATCENKYVNNGTDGWAFSIVYVWIFVTFWINIGGQGRIVIILAWH